LLGCPLTVGVEGAAGSNREGIFRELCLLITCLLHRNHDFRSGLDELQPLGTQWVFLGKANFFDSAVVDSVQKGLTVVHPFEVGLLLGVTGTGVAAFRFRFGGSHVDIVWN